MLTESATFHSRYTTGGCPTVASPPAPSPARTATLIITQISAALRRQPGITRELTRTVRRYLPWLTGAGRPRRRLADRTTERISR